jgi:hypothetical protein
VDDTLDNLTPTTEGEEGAVRFRKGAYNGDSTGVGKGRQVSAILLDNFLHGRKRAIWLSKSQTLLEDARRDWAALGGSPDQIVPLSQFRQGEPIELAEGIIFATYATLRTEAKQGKPSRVEQVLEKAKCKKTPESQAYVEHELKQKLQGSGLLSLFCQTGVKP